VGSFLLRIKKVLNFVKKISCSGHGDIVSWKGGQIILKSLLPIKKIHTTTVVIVCGCQTPWEIH
jgi:hypothetical protein